MAMLLVFASTRFGERAFEKSRLRIFDANVIAGTLPPEAPKSRRSIPLLLILGILGVAAGLTVFAATKRWYDTRNFVLVDMPISLGPGHIKTGEFTTHLKGTYGISIDTGVPHFSYGCLPYAVLKTHWVVTRDDRVTAHRERDYYEHDEGQAIEDTNLFGFDMEPGTYDLDVEVLSDGRCLDAGKP